MYIVSGLSLRFQKHGLSEENKIKLHLMYRMHQVLHAFADKFVRSVIRIVLPILLFLIISSLYSVIRLYRLLNPFILLVLISVGLVASFVISILFSQAILVTHSSQLYCELHSSILLNTKLTKLDKKFFSSLYPLRWKIGESVHFTIERNTFLTIVTEIVAVNIINLLVAF